MMPIYPQQKQGPFGHDGHFARPRRVARVGVTNSDLYKQSPDQSSVHIHASPNNSYFDPLRPPLRNAMVQMRKDDVAVYTLATSHLDTSVQRTSQPPDLNSLQPLPTTSIATQKRHEDDISTSPFSLSPLPYTDEDISLPAPYNAAYPHPLTAYASPGVNISGATRNSWRRHLELLLMREPDLVKGKILAAAPNATLPPSLVVPLQGEGCGIPERVLEQLEGGGDANAISIIATPGGRRPVEPGIAPIRTNFSTTHRRSDTRRAVGARGSTVEAEATVKGHLEWKRWLHYEHTSLETHPVSTSETFRRASCVSPIHSTPHFEYRRSSEPKLTRSKAPLRDPHMSWADDPIRLSPDPARLEPCSPLPVWISADFGSPSLNVSQASLCSSDTSSTIPASWSNFSLASEDDDWIPHKL